MNSLSRRCIIKGAGCGWIAATMPMLLACAAARTSGINVGLQLYTLKAELEKDFEGTLRNVAAIGIHEVELIAFPGRKPEDVRHALRNAGLKAVSLHANPHSLRSAAEEQIDAAGELGVRYLVAAAPALPDRSRSATSMTLDDWNWNADLFNRVGEQSRKSNIQFGYHNHQFEFRHFDGVCAYDELVKRTDPSLVTLQLDCGWAEYAGVSAAEYLRRYPGRFSSVHLKDVKQRASPEAGFDLPGTELGRGIIDWAAVISAAESSGVKHYFLEQEPPFERPAIEAVRMSHEWLTSGRYRR